MKKIIIILLSTLAISGINAYNEEILKAIKASRPEALTQLKDQIFEQDRDYYLKLAKEISRTREFQFKINYIKGIYYPRFRHPAGRNEFLKGLSCAFGGCLALALNAEGKNNNGDAILIIPTFIASGALFYYAYKYFKISSQLNNEQLQLVRTYEELYHDAIETYEILKSI